MPDLEDAIAEEDSESTNRHSPCFNLDGQKVYKAQYLNQLFLHSKNPNSHDHLKHVAQIPWYAIKEVTPVMADNIVVDGSTDDDSQLLLLDQPVATMVHCDSKLFVVIGEVNDIIQDTEHQDQILLDLLGEPAVRVVYQLLYIIPSTTSGDPTLENDWISSGLHVKTYIVPGILVKPLNPALSLAHDHSTP